MLEFTEEQTKIIEVVEITQSLIEQLFWDIQQGIQRYPRDNLLILASDAAALFNVEMCSSCKNIEASIA
ncbi:hypothetical protein [uncultured Oscillibacter sp.]|uniref:hypothetical protein n=1 Tax=uncultured Oscillibacter sp. TaxID=876091 RepID=UPI00262FBA14|nr:hypothetical protein [uncultured Oscillibacter sp.]